MVAAFGGTTSLSVLLAVLCRSLVLGVWGSLNGLELFEHALYCDNGRSKGELLMWKEGVVDIEEVLDSDKRKKKG